MSDEPIEQWTRLLRFSDEDEEHNMSTATDASLYIAGATNGSINGQTNNGGDDTYIGKYSANTPPAYIAKDVQPMIQSIAKISR